MRLNRIFAFALAVAVIAGAAIVIHLWEPCHDTPEPVAKHYEPVPTKSEPLSNKPEPLPDKSEPVAKWPEPTITRPRDIDEIRQRVAPVLSAKLASQGMTFGSPLFIRIFKETKELEVWIARGERYEKSRTYPICAYSGDLGPKLREGDGQSPEGIYAVTSSLLNPKSNYHLSFNLGFPNAYDAHHGRTGSFLMVHGHCVSIGCYAMTDPAMEEIYVLVEAALRGGQQAVPVHIFPFRMTSENLEKHKQSPWIAFWNELKVVHDAFEFSGLPPRIDVHAGKYVMAR